MKGVSLMQAEWVSSSGDLRTQGSTCTVQWRRGFLDISGRAKVK